MYTCYIIRRESVRRRKTKPEYVKTRAYTKLVEEIERLIEIRLLQAFIITFPITSAVR